MSRNDSKKTGGRYWRREFLLVVAVAAAAYLGWRYFFGNAHPDAREMLNITWRVTTPNDRPRATDDGAACVSAIAVEPIDSERTDLDRELARLDPRRAGWESEAISDAIGSQLGKLGKQLARGEPGAVAQVARIVSDDFSCAALRPKNLNLVHDQPPMRVWKADDESLEEAKDDTNFKGAQGLVAAFGEVTGNERASRGMRIKFKVVGIDTSGPLIETRLRVETSARHENDARQTVATWVCRWNPGSAESKPRLRSIDVARYEQAEIRMPGGRLFADCTTAAMGESDALRRQYLRGNNYWSERITAIESMSLLGNFGMALGDVNGDDLEDLYVCDGGGLPNRLFVQQADGTLEDVSAEAGVDWLEYSTAALLLDLDNDDDQDLVVATIELILFMENDGAGKFTLRGAHRSVDDAHSLAAADFDNDGDLDLYVCSYEQLSVADGFQSRGGGGGGPIPYNDANNGSPNALLENRGKFRFLNVTKQVGLNENNTRFSLAASWEDYDNDGDVDLYVANDYGRNNLYVNSAGKFRDIAAEADVEDTASGMSVSWGDCNRDGRMDLYIGNMFSAAGSRITFQQKFASGRSGKQNAALRRMARGNTLFTAADKGRFEDLSIASGASMGRWAWGSRFADLNNDGWEDLVVANGFLTNTNSDDL